MDAVHQPHPALLADGAGKSAGQAPDDPVQDACQKVLPRSAEEPLDVAELCRPGAAPSAEQSCAVQVFAEQQQRAEQQDAVAHSEQMEAKTRPKVQSMLQAARVVKPRRQEEVPAQRPDAAAAQPLLQQEVPMVLVR